MMKRFYGKNAVWFYGVVLFYNLLPLWACFHPDFQWTALMIGLYIFLYLFDLLFIPIMVRNYVDVYDSYFIFRYGIWKDRIDLSAITVLEKSHCGLASSANSLDRIHIETDDKDFYISLKDNDGFIKLIQFKKLGGG